MTAHIGKIIPLTHIYMTAHIGQIIPLTHIYMAVPLVWLGTEIPAQMKNIYRC
jgi:hypothetical protein